MLHDFMYWYYNEFRMDPLYQAMAEVTEDSPWHREDNVGVHTDMVVTSYLAAGEMEYFEDVCGAMACAFHDVGKPLAMEEVYSEERGHYRRFRGHEPLSARLWEDWAVRNFTRLKELGMNHYDIYRVGFMIEHHLPWGLKDHRKLDDLARTVSTLGLRSAFPRMLLADTYGRISDDQEEKRAKSHAWCNEFGQRVQGFDLMEYEAPDQTKPVLSMPIAPSGAGKTTLLSMFSSNAKRPAPVKFSWDDLRLKWYLGPEREVMDPKEEYRVAFERSCEDKEFNSRSQREFIDLVKSGKDIFVDNTNLTRKRRTFFINEARRHGYHVVAYLMPITKRMLIDRQTTRPDKDVPEEAVRRQYNSLQLPQYGEFDDVFVMTFNI